MEKEELHRQQIAEARRVKRESIQNKFSLESILALSSQKERLRFFKHRLRFEVPSEDEQHTLYESGDLAMLSMFLEKFYFCESVQRRILKDVRKNRNDKIIFYIITKIKFFARLLVDFAKIAPKCFVDLYFYNKKYNNPKGDLRKAINIAQSVRNVQVAF